LAGTVQFVLPTVRNATCDTRVSIVRVLLPEVEVPSETVKLKLADPAELGAE
jgi:hypothetical protein